MRVAIVAMGPSSRSYLKRAVYGGGRQYIADQVWAINAMGGVIQHDLLFAMDDCRIQEARAEADTDSLCAGMMKWLKTHPYFFTSKPYPDYPGARAYPLEDVVNAVGTTYFNSTTAYALAYAIYKKVDEVKLFGVDFAYANKLKVESGRACIEFIIGLATSAGMKIEIDQYSELMDACVDKRTKPYGYDAYDVSFDLDGDRIAVNMTECETLPTAEEIEARYRI